MSERILDVTTLGATTAMPTIVRIARERRQADGYRCAPGGWSFAQTTVQLTLAGCGAVWSSGDGAGRPLPAGRALLYANRVHSDLAYGLADRAMPWDFLYINLRGTAATAMIADLAAIHDHAAPLAIDDPVVTDCLALLPPRGHRHRAWSLADSTGLAQRLLLAISGSAPIAAPATTTGDTLVSLAMSELERRLGEAWTIDRLARVLGVSREHLTRVFIARTGEPPATWLRQRRVAAAARLLRGGTSIADIAHACGFADAAHFARIFRRHTGTAPSRFRDAGISGRWD